jgi:hypothetical protein
VDVERVGAVEGELLQAELELAGLAPVALPADAADVDRAVRAERDPVHAGLEALGHPEHRTLVLAADLLQVRPLQAAVGDVAEHHLAGEGALGQHDRVTRRVGDLAVRQPQHGFGHRLAVEGTVRVRVVVEEAVLLDAHQFRRRQVGALVVGDEDVALRPPAKTVRRAQSTGHIGHFARPLVHLEGAAAVGYGLRVGGRAAGDHRDTRGDVEVSLVVQQAERELVVVAAERPGRDPAVLIRDLVSGRVDERGQLMLLGHVEGAVDVLEAHRLLQVCGDPLDGHPRRVGVAVDVVEQVHLAEHTLPGAAPGGDGQPAVRQPVHAGDRRLEAVGTQVRQRVVGMHVDQRQAVTRRVGDALALLAAWRGDARDLGVGAQHRGGHDGEVGRAGRSPRQGEPLVEVAVPVLDAQGVVAGGQVDRTVLRRRPVQAAVVDHLRAAEEQPGPVVAGETEVVPAGGGDVEVGGDLGDESVGEPELRLGGPVDRRHELVDVGSLARFERAVVRQRHLHVEHAQRHPWFLRRDVGLCGGRGRDERESDHYGKQGGEQPHGPFLLGQDTAARSGA